MKDSDNDTLGDHRIDPFIAIPHFMQSNRNEIVRGVGVTAFWTLVSRILGMVRDVVTAALFGLAAGGVMDAFVIAFRLPNLFRRLFGEGILSVSVLPAITEKIENDKPSAWQLISTLLGCVFLLMTLITLVGEVACMLLWCFSADDDIRLVAGLSAVMLPYLVFISLASIVSATLHALNRFGMPAFVPVILNSLWIGVVLWITSREQKDLHAAAYAIAATVFLGGLFQFIAQWAVLRSLGFRWGWNWVACRKSIKAIGKRFVPMAFGLAIFPLNVLVDTMIAWIFSAPADTTMSWWGGGLVYPLSEGTVAAIYFSERLIQFPVGLLGVAIGVVVFPTFSRQASQGDLKQLGTSLRNSMRGNLILAIPATAGLVLLAEPITTLLFEHGEFTQVDVMRTSQMITTYALGIWAYSLVPILVRGFYATGDSRTPVRLGLGVLI
ncbi:MAG: murein biosynthesis integral membrane protein MurJ [Pirellulales bacterium]|nr:murein biosynthesis integral membrane protein MurJ [Pirellulales bacterium]